MIWLAAFCLAVLSALVIWQFYAWERERRIFAEERQQWVAERRDLNNRIQVPQAAPFMSDETTEIPVQHVPFDNDEAFHEAMEEAGRLDS